MIPYGEFQKSIKTNMGLQKKEFIKWVEQYNGINGDHILSGDDLVIPIQFQTVVDGTDYHDFARQ